MSLSPRTTLLNQKLESSPISTSPMIWAPSARKTRSPIFGLFPLYSCSIRTPLPLMPKSYNASSFRGYHQRMLRVVIIKPSKYGLSGHVDRFRRGFMPNSTVPYIRSMTPDSVDSVPVETIAVDEYVQTDLGYLDLLRKPNGPTLLALVGVQSHQFHRSLDLAALARANGILSIIGGPHVMTCDTTDLHGRGISFALAEAETVWLSILRDAIRGELQAVYGHEQRWAMELDAPVLTPPSKRDLR